MITFSTSPNNGELMAATESVNIPMAQKPLVSVIIPSYNHRDYLETAIRSALAQDYTPIQLIVIDDGSKDGSAALLETLSEELGFTFLCHENMGVCRTLNRAIREAAKGEYVALLASDDAWRHDKIRLQIDAIMAMPGSEFCFSRAKNFVNDPHAENGGTFPQSCMSGNVLEKVFLRQHVPAGTMMFSRRLYDRLGGFDEMLKEEDWDFVIRCAAETRFSAVDEPLLFYRAHATNTMTSTPRQAIFQQKAKILAKNLHLVGPWRWALAVAVHFVHDIIVGSLRGR